MDRANFESLLRESVDPLSVSFRGRTKDSLGQDSGELFKTVARQLIPKLVEARGASNSELPRADRLAPSVTERDCADLSRYCLDGALNDAEYLALSLLSRGVELDRVAIELISATAMRLGQRWLDDDISFNQVALASGILLDLVARLQPIAELVGIREQSIIQRKSAFNSPVMPRVHSILIVGLNGNQHSLGPVLGRLLLSRYGFTCFVDPSVSDSGLLHRVSNDWYDAVSISISCVEQLEAAKRKIEQIRHVSRNRNITIIAAGGVFTNHPDAIQRVDADLVGSDGRAICAAIVNLFRSPLS